MKQRQANEQPVSHIDPVSDDEWMEDESEAREEIGATLTALMPWGISILAHVGLIVLAFFLVWQTIVEKEHTPVVPNLIGPPTVSAPSNTIEETMELTSAGGATLSIQVSPTEPVDVVAIGFEMPGLPIVGESFGDLDSSFRGPGKDKIPGIIFDDDVLGSSSDVVFLIDASGSMVDVLPFVINELKRSVNQMQTTTVNNKKFEKKATVIFFSGEGVDEVPGGGGVKGLRTMTPQFKAQISEWVSLENFNYSTGGRGSAHVKAALQRALSYKPQLVILLSDNLTGGGQGATQHELMQDDLLALIHKHNKAQPPAKIDTIQFLYEDPLVRQGLPATLNRIADETGGVFKFISQTDLNLR